jgi:hypothetical protein
MPQVLTLFRGLRVLAGTAGTVSTTALTDSANSFTAADVGRTVSGPNISPGTTIASFQSAGSVTMSATSTGTASNQTVIVGTGGVSIDTGAGTANDEMNYQLTMPKTVTAALLTLQSSPDNTTFTTVATFNNVLQSAGFLRLFAAHRFYRLLVTGFTGTGNIVMTAEMKRAVPNV